MRGYHRDVPAVHLKSLSPPRGGRQIDETLRAIAREVAASTGGEPPGTWCTFTAVDRMSIGEDITTDAGRIVYLDMWIRSRGADVDRDALRAACGAAASGLDVPLEDVWATLRHVQPGFVFAGGGLIEE